jgi:predicted hotdog family 3-hydroxylacyl-ACP dehydratase
MTAMKLEELCIPDLLPQRPPFIMIDRLTYYDPLTARTVFTVREDGPFCRDGRMEEAGLIENIAQTCAVHTGYKTKTEPQRDGVIKIGLIGMIKRMRILRRPAEGEALETTIRIAGEVFSTSLVEAEVEIAGRTVATCEMKIFLTDINSRTDENE